MPYKDIDYSGLIKTLCATFGVVGMIQMIDIEIGFKIISLASGSVYAIVMTYLAIHKYNKSKKNESKSV